MANKDSWKDAPRPTRARFISGTTAGTVDIRIDSYDGESGEVFYTELATGRQGAASERDVVPMEGNWTWNGRGFDEVPAPAPAGGKAGASAGVSLPNIIRKYHAGGYKDRQEAIYALADYFETQGHSEIEALSVAGAKFGDIFGNEGPSSQRAAADAAAEKARTKDAGVGGPPKPTVTKVPPPKNPILSEAAQRELDLSQSKEGRGELFSDYRARLPRVGPFQKEAQERAFTPYNLSFDIGRALGTIGPENTFTNYLPKEFAPLNREAFRQQLGDVGTYMGGRDPSLLSQSGRKYIEGLLKSPAQQHELAFEGVRPDIAPQFQAGAKEVGLERFGRAGDVDLVNSGFGGAERNIYADYLAARGAFSGPTQDEYRAAVQRAAGLLGSETPGQGEDLRETLLKDPERQFSMAMRYQLPNVPWALRQAFGERAERTFRQFRSQDEPSRDPWLAYFAKQGYKF